MNPSMMHRLVTNDIFTLWNLHLVCFGGSLNVENVLVFRDDGILEGELLQFCCFGFYLAGLMGNVASWALKLCIFFLLISNFYRKAL